MLQKLKTFIFQELIFSDEYDNFSNDDDLFEAGLDSMGIMRLLIFIEESFNVSLPDDELEPENLQTINKLLAWIQRHQ